MGENTGNVCLLFLKEGRKKKDTNHIAFEAFLYFNTARGCKALRSLNSHDGGGSENSTKQLETMLLCKTTTPNDQIKGFFGENKHTTVNVLFSF